MQADVNGAREKPAYPDPGEIFEIRDPQVDVEALMRTVRENVARRRAEGAYTEDLDAIAAQVFQDSFGVAATLPSAAADQASITPTLADLNTRWAVREVPFTSHSAIIGPVIVAVRTFWNWMSTKWYVRSILQQQIGFNALVVRAFNENAAAQTALEDELRELKASNQQQRDEIALLREELQCIQARKAPTES